MIRFYTKDITKGQTIFLDANDSKHCCKVLRHRIGDVIELVDGKGGLFLGEIIDDNLRACALHILEKKENPFPRKRYLHLAIGATKNAARMEWLVEKAVEIGVEEITFLETRYTERTKLKQERLEKIAIAAMKQSGRALLPKLHLTVDFTSFLKENSDPKTAKFIAYVPEDDSVFGQKEFASKVVVLVGPEGGFSPEEVQKASECGYLAVSLGKARLRAETAGMVVCQTVAAMELR